MSPKDPDAKRKDYDEPVRTLIPSFSVSGIVTVIIGLAVII
ncbi:MAG TPA: hypothetical protein VFR94_26555 [Nitrososphaeraceae archaeon]|nr:hypothetical protein [Nitrososphaeraceae archaeon]